MEEWQKIHATEKLKQDIRSFRQRMRLEPSPSAEKSDLRTGELEERVNLLKLRIAQANAKVRHTDERDEAKTEIQGQADQGDGCGERLWMRLAKAAKEN